MGLLFVEDLVAANDIYEGPLFGAIHLNSTDATWFILKGKFHKNSKHNTYFVCRYNTVTLSHRVVWKCVVRATALDTDTSV